MARAGHAQAQAAQAMPRRRQEKGRRQAEAPDLLVRQKRQVGGTWIEKVDRCHKDIRYRIKQEGCGEEK